MTACYPLVRRSERLAPWNRAGADVALAIDRRLRLLGVLQPGDHSLNAARHLPLTSSDQHHRLPASVRLHARSLRDSQNEEGAAYICLWGHLPVFLPSKNAALVLSNSSPSVQAVVNRPLAVPARGERRGGAMRRKERRMACHSCENSAQRNVWSDASLARLGPTSTSARRHLSASGAVARM